MSSTAGSWLLLIFKQTTWSCTQCLLVQHEEFLMVTSSLPMLRTPKLQYPSSPGLVSSNSKETCSLLSFGLGLVPPLLPGRGCHLLVNSPISKPLLKLNLYGIYCQLANSTFISFSVEAGKNILPQPPSQPMAAFQVWPMRYQGTCTRKLLGKPEQP